MTMKMDSAGEEDLEDLILSCRYGDLEQVEEFVNRFGADPLDDVQDEFGNTCLHMAAANGHEDVVKYILNNIKKTSTLDRTNSSPASNTPLHWAALNHHLPILKLLCAKMTTGQICKLNGRGMSAMSEAMGSMNSNLNPNNSQPQSFSSDSVSTDPNVTDSNQSTHIPIREQCVNYLVEMMKLGDENETNLHPSQDQDHHLVQKLNQQVENIHLVHKNQDEHISQVQVLR